MKKFLLVFLLFSLNVFADSLEGIWITGDPNPIKRVKVKIDKKDNVYFGTIIEKNSQAPKVCTFCKGTYKDRSTMGAQIIKQMVKDERNPNRYNGKLYNPEDDGTYTGYLELIEDGNKLKAVGKWLVFSRKQIWTRIE